MPSTNRLFTNICVYVGTKCEMKLSPMSSPNECLTSTRSVKKIHSFTKEQKKCLQNFIECHWTSEKKRRKKLIRANELVSISLI